MSEPTPIMRIMRQMMDERIAADEWDETPALYLVAVKSEGDSHWFSVMDMQVPADFWNGPFRPPQCIKLIATVAKEVGGPGVASHFSPPPGHEIIAVMFFSEGWAVKSDKGEDPDVLADKMADADAHTLHLRDDRVEVKMISAVDRQGHNYALSHARDGGEAGEFAIDHVDNGGVWTGAIDEALVQLLDAAVHVNA